MSEKDFENGTIVELETAKLKRRDVQIYVSDDIIEFCEMEKRIEELEKENKRLTEILQSIKKSKLASADGLRLFASDALETIKL